MYLEFPVFFNFLYHSLSYVNDPQTLNVNPGLPSTAGCRKCISDINLPPASKKSIILFILCCFKLSLQSLKTSYRLVNCRDN